jgi:NAD-dependent deacetylase
LFGSDVNLEQESGYQRAAGIILKGRRITAFTGAGISVESGIPPFRGPDGLWSRYDSRVLDIGFFHEHPRQSWAAVKEIFYDSIIAAKPNAAHLALAAMENDGLLHCVITQNVDNLHQKAGNRVIWEFHGNTRILVCLGCTMSYRAAVVDLSELPPTCRVCGGVLKPDFVFFGESIPEPAATKSMLEARLSDVFLLIGTSGEVMPACLIPWSAKENGAAIIEINTQESQYTNQITDVFLQDNATAAMARLLAALKENR